MSGASVPRRLALVTGGNRGIGFEICHGLEAEGFRVLLGSRDRERGRAAANALTGDVTAVEIDVRSKDSVDACAAYIEAQHGTLDVLVNNAGVMLATDSVLSDLEHDVLRETMETNLLGALRTIQAFLPGMRRARRGWIVNLSSQCGSLAAMSDPGCDAAYSISKTALNALTCLAAAESADDGVKVNSMDPGWVQTDMGYAAGDAPRPVTDPVDTAVWLATLPHDGPTGQFFRDRRTVAW